MTRRLPDRAGSVPGRSLEDESWLRCTYLLLRMNRSAEMFV